MYASKAAERRKAKAALRARQHRRAKQAAARAAAYQARRAVWAENRERQRIYKLNIKARRTQQLSADLPT